jgi:hypothetical protein
LEILVLDTETTGVAPRSDSCNIIRGFAYQRGGFASFVGKFLQIGCMAAGTIFIARKIFSPKAEQVFYAMFLMMIASFYLAFAAYFGATMALRVENGRSRGVCRSRYPGAPALRPTRRLLCAPAVGSSARTSDAWSLLNVQAR